MPRNANPGALLDEYIRNFESRYGVVPVTTSSSFLEKERTAEPHDNHETSPNTQDGGNAGLCLGGRSPDIMYSGFRPISAAFDATLGKVEDADYMHTSWELDASSELTTAMVAALKENWSNTLSHSVVQQPWPSSSNAPTPYSASPPPVPRSPSPSSRIPLGQAQRLGSSFPNSSIDSWVPEVPHLNPDAHRVQRHALGTSLNGADFRSVANPTIPNSVDFRGISNPLPNLSASPASSSRGGIRTTGIHYNQASNSNSNSPATGFARLRSFPNHHASSFEILEEPRTPAQPVPWPESARIPSSSPIMPRRAPSNFQERTEWICANSNGMAPNNLRNEERFVNSCSVSQHFFDEDSGELWKQARGLQTGVDFETIARMDATQSLEHRGSFARNSWPIASGKCATDNCLQHEANYDMGFPHPALATGQRNDRAYFAREQPLICSTSMFAHSKEITKGPKPMDRLERPSRPQNAPDFRELRNNHVAVPRGRETQRVRRTREHVEPPMTPRSPFMSASHGSSQRFSSSNLALLNRGNSCPPTQGTRYTSTECAVQTEACSSQSPKLHSTAIANASGTGAAVSTRSVFQKETRWRARRATAHKNTKYEPVESSDPAMPSEDENIPSSASEMQFANQLAENTLKSQSTCQKNAEDGQFARKLSLLPNSCLVQANWDGVGESLRSQRAHLKDIINHSTYHHQNAAQASEKTVRALPQAGDLPSELSTNSVSAMSCNLDQIDCNGVGKSQHSGPRAHLKDHQDIAQVVEASVHALPQVPDLPSELSTNSVSAMDCNLDQSKCNGVGDAQICLRTQPKDTINHSAYHHQDDAQMVEKDLQALPQVRDLPADLNTKSVGAMGCKHSRCSIAFHTGFLGMSFGRGGVVTRVQSFGQAGEHGVLPGWTVLQIGESAVTQELEHEDITELFRKESSVGANYDVIFMVPQDLGEESIHASQRLKEVVTKDSSEENGQVRQRLKDSVSKGLHHLRRLISMAEEEEARQRMRPRRCTKRP